MQDKEGNRVIIKKQAGNKSRRTLVLITYSAVMAALVTVTTLLIQIPNPATGGYINFGEIMIFISALTFGPAVGGFAGSVGSALADIISGYGIFAPFTFVIKGAQGAIAGLIANRRQLWRDIIAVATAGSQMIIGYFLVEFFLLGFEWAALTEVPGNISQVVVGATIGIPIALVLRRTLPKHWRK